MPLPADSRPRTVGPYTILSELGRGGMGIVNRARDSRLHRDVALKVLADSDGSDPLRLERFMREARAASALSHPHILAVFDGSLEGPFPYIVTELIEGGSLRQLLASGPLPVKRLLDLAVQIADGLSAAHRAQLVHRDLKPENVMLSRDGRVKIVDFGLVRATSPTDSLTTTVTSPHLIVGTVPYMSPEQARGDVVDFRSDLFSFGAILYEMATGRRAFERTNTVETLTAIVRDDPRPMRELNDRVPVALSRIVSRCLAKLPDERYGSTADLLHDLQSVRSDSTATVAAVDGQPHISPRALGYVAVAALAAVVLGVGVWRLSRTAAPSSGDGPFVRELSPPPGMVWAELPPEPVPRVSPDGKRVVLAGSAVATDGLWVHALDETEPHRLPGSQDYRGNTQAPFWSADSSTVAFCTRDGMHIRKIRVSDGTSEQIDVLCDGDGSWNERDEILFSGPTPAGLGRALFLVDANGGMPRQVTVPDGSKSEDHRHPRWLPDSRRFIFTVRGAPPEIAGIYLGTIGSRESPYRLAADVSMADFVESGNGHGHLVFFRSGNLIAQPVDIDADSVTLRGSPTELAKKMTIGLSRLPAFSASSSLLAYRTGAGASALVWMDRNGKPTGETYWGESPIESFDLSPDSKTVVYCRRNWDTNQQEIWTIDVATRREEQLFAPPYLAGSAVFSPDTKQVAFSSNDDGKNLRVSLLTLGTKEPPAVHPFATFNLRQWFERTLLGSNGRDVFAVPIDVGTKRRVVTSGAHPQLSPSGEWLAYTFADASGPNVYIQRYPDAGTSRTLVSRGGGFQPQWRGDGEIVYLTSKGEVLVVSVTTTGDRPTASEPNRITFERFRPGGEVATRRDLAIAKDGRMLANLATSESAKVTLIKNWQSLLDSK